MFLELTSTDQVQSVVWATLQNVDIVSGVNATGSGTIVQFVWESFWIASAAIGGGHWGLSGGCWVGGDNTWGASGSHSWGTSGSDES